MSSGKKTKTLVPRYQKIAVDIAAKIANGIYQCGDKLYARSSLAGCYAVSPETARRAICILSDLGIVKSQQGNGVTVLSTKKASAFIEQMGEITSLNDIEESIRSSINRQRLEMENISTQMSELMSQLEHYRFTNPFSPFKIHITDKTPYLGKTISELHFWQNTAATIVALRHDTKMIVSPGPYAVLCESDILYFVGQDTAARVEKFLYPSG
ncbi:MAG: GntR family transcriptional regulator [Treponema sp.]|jgi:K+/H+ antiporter YhaU regulatory subunit KhtT|nr:GntR family transcriptional regulator [Treponema sp.]